MRLDAGLLRQAPAGDADAPDGQTALVMLNFARRGEQEGCTFSYSGGSLTAGEYQPVDLLADAAVASLTVTADGFADYAPLPSLSARAANILLLEK